MVWERNHQSRRQGHTQVAFLMGWMRRTEERKTICSFTGQREVRYPKSVKVFVLLNKNGRDSGNLEKRKTLTIFDACAQPLPYP